MPEETTIDTAEAWRQGEVNVAARLTAFAQRQPLADAVRVPRRQGGKLRYVCHSFQALNEDSTRIARGLVAWGVRPGTRLALLVRPGYEFVALVFALLKSGAVQVLIDPGLGRRNMIRCLAEAEPEGFVAVPAAQAVRTALRRKFPKARWNVTVGRRWFWGGPTLNRIRAWGVASGREQALPVTGADDPAAIIFTTGSTGPSKGVLYTHGNFDRQVQELEAVYQLARGGVDLACFPLFGLFNSALGVTTVVPEMDAARPAAADPRKLAEAILANGVTQSFASPAVWNRLGRHCAAEGLRLPTLARVFSAGAPVAPSVIERVRAWMHPEGEVHTPYGATEALPVASIESRELLDETAPRSRRGAGTCVGRRFPGIEWRVIRIVEGPIRSWGQAEPVPPGEIGELVVRGAVVTRQYATRVAWNEWAKIPEGDAVWHRMGDAGYLDAQDRFWFCGRVAHRVETAERTLFSTPCEAIFEEHPAVFRAALVGLGERPRQTPVICVELESQQRGVERRALFEELRRLALGNPLTAGIERFLVHPAFPVDIRHNAKIFRERLAAWAAGQGE